MNTNHLINNQNHVVTMKSKPVSSANMMSTQDSLKQDTSMNMNSTTTHTPHNSMYTPGMPQRKPTNSMMHTQNPSHTPNTSYRVSNQVGPSYGNDSLNVSLGNLSTSHTTTNVSHAHDTSTTSHVPAFDAIHRLYHDRDQLMSYLQQYHLDMEKREQKFRHIFTHLTKTLEKAQSDIHSLQTRESQLRDLCKDILHQQGTNVSSQNDKEDHFWNLMHMKVNKLSGIYEHDGSGNMNSTSMANTSTSTTQGSTFLSQSILQGSGSMPKPGMTSSVVQAGSFNQLRAQHNELLKHNTLLHQRLEVMEAENTKLRTSLKTMQASQTRKQWDKQRQQLITCVKRIEMLVKDREQLQKKQKSQDSYIYKLENTILKLRKEVQQHQRQNVMLREKLKEQKSIHKQQLQQIQYQQQQVRQGGEGGSVGVGSGNVDNLYDIMMNTTISASNPHGVPGYTNSMTNMTPSSTQAYYHHQPQPQQQQTQPVYFDKFSQKNEQLKNDPYLQGMQQDTEAYYAYNPQYDQYQYTNNSNTNPMNTMQDAYYNNTPGEDHEEQQEGQEEEGLAGLEQGYGYEQDQEYQDTNYQQHQHQHQQQKEEEEPQVQVQTNPPHKQQQQHQQQQQRVQKQPTPATAAATPAKNTKNTMPSTNITGTTSALDDDLYLQGAFEDMDEDGIGAISEHNYSADIDLDAYLAQLEATDFEQLDNIKQVSVQATN